MNRRRLLSIFPFSLFAGKAVAAERKPQPPNGHPPRRGFHIDIRVVRPSEFPQPNYRGVYLTDDQKRPYLRAAVEYQPASGEKVWAALESPRFNETGTKEDKVAFRWELTKFFDSLQQMMRQMAFPHDARMADAVYDEDKKAWTLAGGDYYLRPDGSREDEWGNPITNQIS